jgi:hypothetical protein
MLYSLTCAALMQLIENSRVNLRKIGPACWAAAIGPLQVANGSCFTHVGPRIDFGVQEIWKGDQYRQSPNDDDCR